jgi:phage/plasmid-associated DNA primase
VSSAPQVRLGCRDYFEVDGLDVPDAIQREINQYQREQDSIAQFIEEKCVTLEQARSRVEYVIAADYRVSNGDLYKAYKHFCEPQRRIPTLAPSPVAKYARTRL